jgi:hypothetical protein
MGQFSVEKPVLPGSVLSGNQHANGTWVDFLMPLNNGGTVTKSVMIEHGLKASTQYYSGDSQA